MVRKSCPISPEVQMNQKDLKKLRRTDLLELLLEERRENEMLRNQLDEACKKLDDRTVKLENAGSIAEASLQLNGVFEAAESAAAQYLENIRRLSGERESVCQRMEAEARKKAEIIRAEADEYSRSVREEVDKYQRHVLEKIQTLLKDQDGLHSRLNAYFEEQNS